MPIPEVPAPDTDTVGLTTIAAVGDEAITRVRWLCCIEAYRCFALVGDGGCRIDDSCDRVVTVTIDPLRHDEIGEWPGLRCAAAASYARSLYRKRQVSGRRKVVHEAALMGSLHDARR